jgi:PLAC8 family
VHEADRALVLLLILLKLCTVQPPEGVKQGEKFVAELICPAEADADADADRLDAEGEDLGGHHRIPHGRWRDGICDCFVHGLCHPMLWLACCCRPLAIGQILTRMYLTAMGNPILHGNGSRRPRASAFQVVACVFAVVWAVDYALTLLWSPYMVPPRDDDHATPPSPDDNPGSSIPAWALMAHALQTATKVLFGAYLLALLIRARAHVRQRYDIPEQCCVGCEDCCCAFWLPCCTALQIARHTADYSQRRSAACCTDTGLPPRRRNCHPHHPDDDHGVPFVV